MPASTNNWPDTASKLWIATALTRAKTNPFTLDGLAKELKKTKLPPNVSRKMYSKVVHKALRDSKLLVVEKNKFVLAKTSQTSAPTQSAALIQHQPSIAASHGGSSEASGLEDEFKGHVEYWAQHIKQAAQHGVEIFSFIALKQALSDSMRGHGSISIQGKILNMESFYQEILKALKSYPGMVLGSSGGKQGFRWTGTGNPHARRDVPVSSQVVPSGPGPAAFSGSRPASAPSQHMTRKTCERPLRSEVVDLAGLTDVTATYAELHLTEMEGLVEGVPDNETASLSGDSENEAESASSFKEYFLNRVDPRRDTLSQGLSIADESHKTHFKESALLGSLSDNSGVYLNTHEPFCCVTVGVQGAGKSHTLACVLESCLIPFPEADLIRLNVSMTALVLHYDQSINSVCEATGLLSPTRMMQRMLGKQLSADRCVARDRMVVLVSPSNYIQRKAFYGNYCIVKPLLLRWHTLSADHIKRIMRIKDGDNQLYVAALLDLLRRYQRQGLVPTFSSFVKEVSSVCNANGQEGPLRQRLALLASMVAESDLNASIHAEGGDIIQLCKPGQLVVVDLTDPLLSSEEANGIFQVLTEQFRAIPTTAGCGKILALDEAHKYMDGVASDGLSQAIVNTARLMRHDGVRLVLSTQSPRALAPELLELVSVAILHRFHSADWFSYLSKKLPLDESVWQTLVSLDPGHAVMFASRHAVSEALSFASFASSTCSKMSNVFAVAVRPRITADRGASRRNVASVCAAADTASLPNTNK